MTDGQVALDLAMQALARRDQQTVILALGLNPALLRTPLGTALVMAGHLAAGQGEHIRVAARGMAGRDADEARQVAEALRQVAGGVPEGTLPAEDLAAVLTDLEGGT